MICMYENIIPRKVRAKKRFSLKSIINYTTMLLIHYTKLNESIQQIDQKNWVG